jgi:hypothetical protein
MVIPDEKADEKARREHGEMRIRKLMQEFSKDVVKAEKRFSSQMSTGPLTDEEKQLFLTLGEEALQENGDWLLLHRDRHLEIFVT